MVTGVKTIKQYFRMICILICAIIVAFAFTVDRSFAASSFNKTKVTDVKARVVENRTVQVSWKKRPGADGYVIYYAMSAGGKYREGANAGKDSTKAKIGSLKIGNKYYFKVRAYREAPGKREYGKYSERVKCYITPAPPKVTVNAVEPSTKKLRVSFTKSTGAAGYVVYRAKKGKDGKVGKYKKIRTLPASKRKFIDNGLSSNTRYYYKVKSFANPKKKKNFSSFSKAAYDVTGGNSNRFALKNIKRKNGQLTGKRVLFLGSSITKGSKSGGVSFVDYLAKRDGLIVEKKAVGGTTLSTVKKDSYVSRLRKVKMNTSRRLVICQLSANDARYNIDATVEDGEEASVDQEEYQEPSEEVLLRELDKKTDTVRGAIDYIIVYSNYKLKCPVTFYVIPPFKSTANIDAKEYARMKKTLIEASRYWKKEGYSVDIIDLQNTEKYPQFKGFNQHNKDSDKRAFYMRDAIHPTKAGYYKKYLPAFEKYLKKKLN